MRALILAALLLAGCSPTIVERPVMSPVDTPRAPKGIATKCGVDFPPITLPTTAEEQAAGRKSDRELAQAAIETCDGRRERAVRHIRRLGATE